MKKAQIIVCLILVVFSAIRACGADAFPVMRVESSCTMKVAIINADQHNPANGRMHQALATSLGFEISQHYKAPMPVKAVEVSSRDAALGLSNGTYDLVAVIGSAVPPVLLNSDFKHLKAVPTTGNPHYVISLLVLKEDRTLCTLMDHSFQSALNETFFRLAFANYQKASGEGEKIAWNVAVAALR